MHPAVASSSAVVQQKAKNHKQQPHSENIHLIFWVMMQSLLPSKTLLMCTCESGRTGCALVLNPVVDYLSRIRRNRWSCTSISSLAEGTFMYNSLPGCKCIHRCLHCAVKCGLAGKQAVALSLQTQHPHSSDFRQQYLQSQPAFAASKQPHHDPAS